MLKVPGSPAVVDTGGERGYAENPLQEGNMQKGWVSGIGAVGVVVAALVLGSGAWAQDLTGDAEHGATVFKKCQVCHRVGPNAKNAVGPELNGILGEAAGVVPGYSFSDALKNSGITWDKANLQEWVQGPKDLVPGTKMTFAGLTNPQDAADVVAYLSQFDANGNKAASQ